MQDIHVETWEEFEGHLQKLLLERAQRRETTALHISPFLFRGHADASWPLRTSLERYVQEPPTIEEYYQIIHAAKPQIKTYTSLSWNIPAPTNYARWLDGQDTLVFGQFPAYDYMVYLRHHGFPSPLLDWTRSPYVAAYFAFMDASEKVKNVAIYAYWEAVGHGKSGAKGSPCIESLGPYVHSHRRHFLQQSQYTICSVWKDGIWHFAQHDDVLASSNTHQQFPVKSLRQICWINGTVERSPCHSL